MEWVLLGLCVLLFLAWFIPLMVRKQRLADAVKKRAEDVMAGRAALTHEEFGRHFFPPEQAEMAAVLRDILEDYIGLDLARAQPGDNMFTDLGLSQLDGLEDVEMVMQIEDRFKVKLDEARCEKVVTLRDLVECVASACRVAPSPRNSAG